MNVQLYEDAMKDCGYFAAIEMEANWHNICLKTKTSGNIMDLEAGLCEAH